jgi:hypothetical protein
MEEDARNVYKVQEGGDKVYNTNLQHGIRVQLRLGYASTSDSIAS